MIRGNESQMTQSEIQITRELANETVAQLVDVRRRRKAKEAEREAATADERALLEAAEEPFTEPLAALGAEETELKAMATETLVDFDKARRAELLAGRECPAFKAPDGCRVDWKETAEVPDPAALPLGFQSIAPKRKEILAALKKGTAVKGASLIVAPVVVVGEE